MKINLTVFFEDPFWVGVFERFEDETLSVCRVTFGAEPKDCEIKDYVLRNYSELTFSSAVGAEIWLLKRMEPVYRHYPWKSLLKSGFSPRGSVVTVKVLPAPSASLAVISGVWTYTYPRSWK